MPDAHPSNQMGCDAFRINYSCIRRHVEMQVLLMHASKTTLLGPERRARSRIGIAVDLAAAISIIPRPLMHTMTDNSMRWTAPLIALPLIGIELGAGPREILGDESRASVPISMVASPEALLTCSPRDDAENGWTIVGVGPMPSPLIRPPTSRIIKVGMGRAFFPPRFGIVRRPQKPCPA
jgi:hypothetical protein